MARIVQDSPEQEMDDNMIFKPLRRGRGKALAGFRKNPGSARSEAIAEVFVVNAPSPCRPHLFLVAVAAVSLPGCVEATAFDTEPPVTGLTRDNLDRLNDRQPSSMPFKFVAIGDVHDAYDELAEAVDAINLRDDVDFVAVAGDVTNLGLLQEYEWTYEEFRRLDVPYFVVIGNHDALGDGKELYGKMYGPLEFAFTYSGVRFLFFNSNALEFVGTAPNEPWLRAEHDALGGTPAIWVTHQNVADPNDSPGTDTGTVYRALVEANEVPLVVHGHLEEFELDTFFGADRLQCATFEVFFSYNVVTVYPDRLEYLRCWNSDCEPVPAPVDSEGDNQ